MEIPELWGAVARLFSGGMGGGAPEAGVRRLGVGSTRYLVAPVSRGIRRLDGPRPDHRPLPIAAAVPAPSLPNDEESVPELSIAAAVAVASSLPKGEN